MAPPGKSGPYVELEMDAVYGLLEGKGEDIELAEAQVRLSPRDEALIIDYTDKATALEQQFRVSLTELAVAWNMLARAE